MYDQGQGVAQDYKQAVSWYRKAADQGFANAQTQLGLSYFLGGGVIQDSKQARDWLVKAALQGDARAMFGMAFVADTKTEQYAWFNLASAYGYSDARKLRDGLAKEMTAQQLAAGQDRIRELQKLLSQ